MPPPLIRLKNPLVYPGDRRPGFDPSHPAAGGIKGKIGFSGVATPIGFLRPDSGAPTASTQGSPTYPVTSIGPAMLGTTGQCQQFNVTSRASPSKATFAAIIQPTSVAATKSIFCTTTSSTGFGYTFRLNSGGKFCLTLNSVADVAGTNTVFAANIPYFYAASINGGVAANFIAVNLKTGQVNTQTVSTASTAGGSDINYAVGREPPSGVDVLSGYIAAVMYSPNLFMNAPQLAAWGAAPWEFWYPPRVEQIIVSGLTTVIAGYVAAAAGTGAAVASSQAIKGATAADAGIGAATAIGARIAQVTAAAAGIGAASGIGAEVLSAIGAASGAGAASATSQAIWQSIGAATGAGVALAVGNGIRSAAGQSAGVGAATAPTGGIWSSNGAASGQGAALATSRQLNTAVGNAAGLGSASSVSQIVESALALAYGIGDAIGIGASIIWAIADADGFGDAFAIGFNASFADQICDLDATMAIGEFGAMMKTEQLMATMSTGGINTIVRCH